jgi:dsDNA-specific endonuclease/ATPase MutS2
LERENEKLKNQVTGLVESGSGTKRQTEAAAKKELEQAVKAGVVDLKKEIAASRKKHTEELKVKKLNKRIFKLLLFKLLHLLFILASISCVHTIGG